MRDGAGRRRGGRHDRSRRISRGGRQLERVGRPAGQRASDELGDCRSRIVSMYGRPIQASGSFSSAWPRRLTSCNRPCGSTTMTHLDHAGEDRFHAGAIACLFAKPAARPPGPNRPARVRR